MVLLTLVGLYQAFKDNFLYQRSVRAIQENI
jgi:hypothetical protein